jgi:hypothetical protein
VLAKERFVLHFESQHRTAVDHARITGRAYSLIFWGSVLHLPIYKAPSAQNDQLFQLRLSAGSGVIAAYDGWCKYVGVGRARGLLWLDGRLPTVPPLPTGWHNGPIAATAGYSERIGYKPPPGVGIAPQYLRFFNETWSETLDSLPP